MLVSVDFGQHTDFFSSGRQPVMTSLAPRLWESFSRCCVFVDRSRQRSVFELSVRNVVWCLRFCAFVCFQAPAAEWQEPYALHRDFRDHDSWLAISSSPHICLLCIFI